MKKVCLLVLALCVCLCWIAEGEDLPMFDNQTMQQCAPYGYDLERGEALGLAQDGHWTDEYFRLQSLYGRLCFEYMDMLLDLRGLDEALAQADARFIAVTEPRNVYQEMQSYGMSYLYLRNTVCVERLTGAQLAALRAIAAADEADGEAIQTLVEESWPLVLAAAAQQPADMHVFYDLTTGQSALNHALVLGLATAAEYDAEGRVVSSRHEHEKIAMLESLAKELEAQLSAALGHPVTVFVD